MSKGGSRNWLEVAIAGWALALLILGAVHLTAADAYAGGLGGGGVLDCDENCDNFCGIFGSDCDSADEGGCSCVVYCENGEQANIYCN